VHIPVFEFMNKRKALIQFFEEKFEANLSGRTLQDAFEKTNEDLGFDAYGSYRSFSVCRKRARKNKRER
jgi:hypothetical protein